MKELLMGMLQSKTMWFNGGMTALGLIGWITGHSGMILAVAPQLAPLLTVIGAIGMVLRVLTESSVAWKAPVADATPVPAAPIQQS